MLKKGLLCGVLVFIAASSVKTVYNFCRLKISKDKKTQSNIEIKRYIIRNQ